MQGSSPRPEQARGKYNRFDLETFGILENWSLREEVVAYNRWSQLRNVLSAVWILPDFIP